MSSYAATCINCVTRNSPESRYCRECGAHLPIAGDLPLDNEIAPRPSDFLASFWRRFAAWIIDGTILSFVSGALVRFDTVGLILLSVILIGYWILPFSRPGQTFGKIFLGIEVIGADGEAFNWRKRALRFFGATIGLIPLSLGYLWSIWDGHNQTWHDKWAGTIVVRKSADRSGMTPIATGLSQRRWLLWLGMPSLVIVAVGVVWIVSTFRGALSEISDMGPWPSAETTALRAVDVDLTHLGCEIGDRYPIPIGSFGSHEDAAAISFFDSSQFVASVLVLKFPDKQEASQSFEMSKFGVGLGCGRTFSFTTGSKGLFRCGANGRHNTMYWNDRWVVQISAIETADYTASELAGLVRDALSDHCGQIEPIY